MDTAAYLSKHGWLGTGHSLRPNGHGIAKPIHITKKLDLQGVGKRKHDIHADQWWARMFDSTLKDLQIGEQKSSANSEASSAASSGKPFDGPPQRQPNIIERSALYRNFVKGESLAGTIEVEVAKQLEIDNATGLQCQETTDRKVKSRRSRKAKRRTRSSSPEDDEEQKEARRLRRVQRRENAKDDRNRRKVKKRLQGGDDER